MTSVIAEFSKNLAIAQGAFPAEVDAIWFRILYAGLEVFR